MIARRLATGRLSKAFLSSASAGGFFGVSFGPSQAPLEPALPSTEFVSLLHRSPEKWVNGVTPVLPTWCSEKHEAFNQLSQTAGQSLLALLLRLSGMANGRF